MSDFKYEPLIPHDQTTTAVPYSASAPGVVRNAPEERLVSERKWKLYEAATDLLNKNWDIDEEDTPEELNRYVKLCVNVATVLLTEIESREK